MPTRNTEHECIDYGYIEGVEHPGNYLPGGYHPIYIGDRLHNRYRVVHKLGYGTFSTTWLALDSQTRKYVAIKVGTTDADKQEADILSRLTAGVTAGSDASDLLSRIPLVFDRFDLEGTNGTHACFVTAPERCSFRDSREDGLLFQLDVARSMAAQLVLAVSFVHSQGYCHGDLHLGNLLLRLNSPLDNLSVDQLYAKFGAPEQDPVVRVDGKPNVAGVPKYIVPPMWLGVHSEKIMIHEAKLLLNDFGVAFRPSDEFRLESNAPLAIRAPEAWFEPTTPLSYASDIWSLGCTIFDLLGHRPPIDGSFLATQDYITAQQVNLQGPMPAEWWSRWMNRPEWFDDAGKPLGNECDIWSWDRVFEEWVRGLRPSQGMDSPGDEEKAALLQLLQRMLAWRPAERPSARDVLDSAWMKKWALPAYEESRKAW